MLFIKAQSIQFTALNLSDYIKMRIHEVSFSINLNQVPVLSWLKRRKSP